MKKILVAICLLGTVTIPSQELAAQKWAAGLRTGFTQDNLQLNDQFDQGSNLMWYKQAFLNRRLNKHWEIELAVGHNQLSNDKTFVLSNEPSAVFFQDWKTDYLTLSLHAKYYFFQKGKWEGFGMAGLGSTKVWSNYHAYYTGTLTQTPHEHFSGEGTVETSWLRLSAITAGAGVNYNLTQHLQLSGLVQVSYKADLNADYGSSVNHSDFYPVAAVGIGYRF